MNEHTTDIKVVREEDIEIISPTENGHTTVNPRVAIVGSGMAEHLSASLAAFIQMSPNYLLTGSRYGLNRDITIDSLTDYASFPFVPLHHTPVAGKRKSTKPSVRSKKNAKRKASARARSITKGKRR